MSFGFRPTTLKQIDLVVCKYECAAWRFYHPVTSPFLERVPNSKDDRDTCRFIPYIHL